MFKRFSKIMTSALAILVVLGAVANTAAAIESCMPKACCCQKNAVLSDTNGLHGNAALNCHGSGPCCQVEPPLPFPEMAIAAIPETPAPKSTAIAVLPDLPSLPTQHTNFKTFSYTVVNLKIPLPPIYIQNQSFLI